MSLAGSASNENQSSPADMTMFLAQAGQLAGKAVGIHSEGIPYGRSSASGVSGVESSERTSNMTMSFAPSGRLAPDGLAAGGEVASTGNISASATVEVEGSERTRNMQMFIAPSGRLTADSMERLGEGVAKGPETVTVTSGFETADQGAGRVSVHSFSPDREQTDKTGSTQIAADRNGGSRQIVETLQSTKSEPGLPHRPQKLRGELAAEGGGGAESRVNRTDVLLDIGARESIVSATLVANGLGDGIVRQSEKAAGKASGLQVGTEIAGGGWGEQASQVNSGVDNSSFVLDPSTASLESMVADTVGYWTTQGIQNAELKLEGFGSQPVEVSISLNGDEAHIGFRTDQPEIRNILEGAVAHLKELLTNEGLVLSGFSIGSSAQGGTNSQDRRDQPGSPPMVIAIKEPESRERPRRVNLSSVGRSVDLFV